MYRRIQLINDLGNGTSIIHGLCGMSTDEVAESWAYDLRGCKRNMPENIRFYFTENGWNEVGRKVITAAQKSGQRYRIIKVKENSVDVFWSDNIEVAAQPRRKRD